MSADLAVQPVLDGQVVETLDREAAVALTERMVATSTDLLDLVRQARDGRVWLAMGRASMGEWWQQDVCAAGTLRVARQHLAPLIHALAAEGASTREIAAATGVSQSTASRAVRVAESNDSPQPRKAPRRPWPTAFNDVHHKVDKTLISLENLVKDDRASRHADESVRYRVARLAERVAALQAALDGGAQ